MARQRRAPLSPGEVIVVLIVAIILAVAWLGPTHKE